MSPLQSALDEYLAGRRALGHKLRLSGRLLQRFVEFADHAGATCITTELAVEWATQPADAKPAQWANRLGMVRRFAQYCSAIDPRTAVPPPDLLPHRYRRPAPYVYRHDRLPAFSKRRHDSQRSLACGLIPIPRSSACMWRQACDATNHSSSIAIRWIWWTAC
jgi:hypothetical protein